MNNTTVITKKTAPMKYVGGQLLAELGIEIQAMKAVEVDTEETELFATAKPLGRVSFRTHNREQDNSKIFSTGK